MDKIPTVIQVLKGMDEAYRQMFHKRALELELAARASGQHELAELYAEVVDAYLDAFDVAWLEDDIEFEELVA